ncbi:TIGR02206 family membrane protein [Sediminibacillus massiliensis]|uniref:YwaF family protein n=1 Tax=Sediminibacillus massiliensis TaxID=1926277 RepID=UPI00098887AA|nr:TIGR02206 family membrane protein [Sediminibacillus massiliensis]
MDSWFGVSSESVFTPFSASHLLMLAIYLLGVALIMQYSGKIARNATLHAVIHWTLFTLLVLSELSYQYWAVYHGIWSFNSHAPLHLCGIASLMAIISLLVPNERIVAFTYFIGFLPAFLALITPDLPYGPEHFRFWKFFVHHIAISWTSLFLVIGNKKDISFKSMIDSYLYLIVYALIVGLFVNPLSDSNYLYLSGRSNAYTLLHLFGEGIWYYINLGLTALLSFLLLYFLAKTWRSS